MDLKDLQIHGTKKTKKTSMILSETNTSSIYQPREGEGHRCR